MLRSSCLAGGGLLGSRVIKMLLERDIAVVAVDVDLTAMKNKIAAFDEKYEEKDITWCAIDISKPEEVLQLFNEQTDISGLVNCSYPRNKEYGHHFFDVSLESFNDNTSLLLGTSFFVMQQSAAYFKRHLKPFSLVNIASIYGHVAPKFDIYENTKMTVPVEYAAAKAAVIHLTKYVSNYVNDPRFKINCLSPGGILDNQPQIFQDNYRRKTNGKGMLDVDEVANSIMFLLFEQSNGIAGQNIVIDDGFSNH